nr:phospholipase-like protein [Tanacetum cinerariifolium]
MVPHIEAKHSVKLSDVMVIFDKMCDRSVDVEDNDAVKICLLVLLEQGFLGHQMSHNISDDKLKLVENLSNCWNIFPWGSYIWENTYSQLRYGLHKRKVRHDAKREKGEKIQYTMTGFVWAFMIWILEAIPATHLSPTIGNPPRALAWESTQPFTWSRCCTLFVRDQLAPPLETLTPTKGESETDWWKASLEYFEGKHVEREAVSQLEFEKDGISEKKRKRGSSQSSLSDPTYDQLMTTVTKLEGTIATLTKTISSLHGTITTLESRLLVVEMRCTIPPPASTTMPPVTTISVPKDAAKDVATHLDVVTTISAPMTTTEKLKDTIHIDAATQDTFCIEDELQFKGMEKGDKPNYALPDLSKLKRNKYPIYSKFEKKKTDCYLDCLPKGRTCEPSFWDILYPGGEKAEYLEEEKLDGLRLDGLHINAFIELMMRKRPRNAQWTLGLCELVAFHIDSRKLMSMVSVVDALRATIDGTNP